MFEATEKAIEVIKQYVKQQNLKGSIRIAMSEGGWAGPSLGLALDEPKETDHVFERDSVTFLVDKELFNKARPITVDYVKTDRGEGFSVKSGIQSSDCCGTCSC